MMAVLEKFTDREWVAFGTPEKSQWPVPLTPELLEILLTPGRNTPENELLKSPQGLAWDHGKYQLPDRCTAQTRKFYEQNKKVIDKVCWYTLDEIQSYPWHEPVQQSGWVRPQEVQHVRQFGRVPQQWTKTTKDPHNNELVSWTVSTAILCREFVQTFIPRLRDTDIEPGLLRVVFFKIRVVGKASQKIVDLSEGAKLDNPSRRHTSGQSGRNGPASSQRQRHSGDLL